MGLILLAIFIGVPLTEIAVFIAVGERVGLWPTLATVILTAIIGSFLLRQQGVSTLMRAQQASQRGELPIAELLEGLYLVIAGLLLLTPGFVTDAFGLTLFIPGFRRWLGRRLLHSLSARGHINMSGGPGERPSGPAPPGSAGPVIDGEFSEVPPDDDGSQNRPLRPPVVPPKDTC